jgi:hypothetical protein
MTLEVSVTIVICLQYRPQVNGGSTVVDQSTHILKIQGSNLTIAGTGRERDSVKTVYVKLKWVILFFVSV